MRDLTDLSVSCNVGQYSATRGHKAVAIRQRRSSQAVASGRDLIVTTICALQVNCFIVRKGAKGYKQEKIENKISLRCVQNANMTFDRCFVPDTARLPGVNSFQDTNKVRCTLSAWIRCCCVDEGSMRY